METLPRSRRTNNKIAMRVTAMIALLFSRSIFRLVSLEKYSSFVYVFYFILGLGRPVVNIAVTLVYFQRLATGVFVDTESGGVRSKVQPTPSEERG